MLLIKLKNKAEQLLSKNVHVYDKTLPIHIYIYIFISKY